MRITSVAPIALLLAATLWSMPASAQGVPRGSYLQSCTDISMRGDTLYAVCRRMDGRMRQTYLRAVGRCVGDIGNNNGRLQCAYAGGPPPYGQQPPPPPPYGQPPPPPPGYGR